MKCTTKIVLGIIAAIFVLSILLIIYVAILFGNKGVEHFSHTTRRSSSYVIPQDELKTTRLDSFKVVYLKSTSDINDVLGYLGGTLTLSSPKTGKEGARMTVPADLMPYIKVKTVGDTLNIEIDRSAIYNFYKKLKEKEYINIDGLNIDMYLSDMDIKVISEVANLSTTANGLHADKIEISTVIGSVRVESCVIGHFDAKYANGHLSVNKSTIDTLTLDLDLLGGWNVTDSRIDVENLTGSRYHSIRQSKAESNTVNWTPKTKEAELNITIPNDTVRIIFP